MNSSDDTRYRQVEGLDVHEAEDGLIAFNPENDRVHHLNPAAGVAFELCAQTQSRRELIESFNTLFDLDDESGTSALDALNRLLSEGVLVEVDDS